jgi:hypothetical protein
MDAKENIQMTIVPGESYADSSTAVMSADGSTDTSIAIGAPEPTPAPKVTVYADSIGTTEYCSAQEGIATFDVIFSVTIDDGGSYKTYKIVKRIGVNKAKIAAEVENIRSITVVESVKTEDKEKISVVEQFRRLAGL